MVRRVSTVRVATYALAGASLLLLGLPSACSVTFGAASAADDSGASQQLNDWEAGAGDGAAPLVDGDASPGSADASVAGYQGSPLCNASSSKGCFPDDPANAQSCNLATDAGSYPGHDGDAGSPYACHVSPTTSSEVGPVQVCTSAGTGIDGAACTTGTDCAAGFECVGEGTCRHYCCDPTACDDAHSFCDIQTILDAPIPDTRVPVCMPVSACKLLSAPSCQTNETCAVVKASDWTTSCVPVGPQLAGQECETDHCAADLVCLGPLGSRVCYQLCLTTGENVCQPGQTCTGSAPEFTDPSVGVCQ